MTVPRTEDPGIPAQATDAERAESDIPIQAIQQTEVAESAKSSINAYIIKSKIYCALSLTCTLVQFLILFLVAVSLRTDLYFLLIGILTLNLVVLTLVWNRNTVYFQNDRADLLNKIGGDSAYIEKLGSIWVKPFLPFYVWFPWIQLNAVFFFYKIR